jgi:hypothetical protein
MPRRPDFDDDWNDDSYLDDEWGDDGDDELTETDDLEGTAPCPYCQREIHKESERCPYCERYLSEEDVPPSRKPWWLTIGVVACFIVVYLWITRR